MNLRTPTKQAARRIPSPFSLLTVAQFNFQLNLCPAMTRKRSRRNQSRTFAAHEGVLIDRLPPPELLRLDVSDFSTAVAHQTSRSVFALSSPPREGAEQVKPVYFLERCHYCKKTLNPDQNIYMFGDFNAFCTPECCDAEIKINQAAKKGHGGTTGASTSSSR